MADDDHGDQRHITMQTMRQAAEAANISIDEVAANIDTGFAGEATVTDNDES